MPQLIPAIFFGHGNPMNAVMTNGYTEAWRRIGAETRKPKAILSISAHWYVPGTGVTISTSPRTIHDFGGFPRELFRVQYPAPGDYSTVHDVPLWMEVISHLFIRLRISESGPRCSERTRLRSFERPQRSAKGAG
jgi:aromatic ring-opening dioxygenase catalytic subunit (LigB family)